MADTKKLMRNELLEVRGSIDQVCERVGGMKGCRFTALAETVDRRGTTRVKLEEHIKALDLRVEAQAAALEQMRQEMLSMKLA